MYRRSKARLCGLFDKREVTAGGLSEVKQQSLRISFMYGISNLRNNLVNLVEFL